MRMTLSAKKKPKVSDVDYLQVMSRIADENIRQFIEAWNATVPGSIAALTSRPPFSFRHSIGITMPDKRRNVSISTEAAQLIARLDSSDASPSGSVSGKAWVNQILETNPVPVKAALAMLGVCTEEVRLPLVPLSDKSRAQLSETLKAVL